MSVKEFYAKMSMIHLKKKDVVKSKVRGVEMEFDHEKLATILGILGNNGICEYVKDVWEESKYIKSLEITKRFANNETLTATRRALRSARRDSSDELHKVRLDRRNRSLRSRPSCLIGRIPEAELLKFQAEFERKRANRFHDDLEKAKAENARLLALLHQAQSKPHP
ncbi:hypothetical protein Dimus_015482 [Dionaea muscipula]